MSDLGKAIFLSYASQDAEAAKRICEALRAAGLEVWFDQSELRGGDAWDAKIRKQIKECALFVPVISATTNARPEGYFRLEWKLAVDRSHLLADDHPFLFPVVIDETADATARVPEKFRDVQWTRLSVKDTPETLAVRVGKLLAGDVGRDRRIPPTAGSGDPALQKRTQPAWLRYAWAGVGIVFALVYAVRPLFQPERRAEPKPAVSATTADPKLSAARQLAYQARALIDQIDSSADDYAAAEGLLKRALELDQNDGEVWALSSRLNSLYLSRGFGGGNARAEAARSQSERALKLAPDSVETLLAVARANRITDAPRAEAALRQALVLAPNDGPVLLNLGSLYRVQNRLDEAMIYYERAAAVPAVRSLALYDQFLVSFYRRQLADADRYVRDSIAVVPTANSVTGLAMVELTWHGQPEAALRVLAAAPSKLRNEPRFVITTVLAAQMNRQPEEALAALRRFPADYVNDAWYTGPKALLVGLCEAQAGRAEAARVAWESGIALLQRRLQDAPNNTNEHLRLGELLAWSGQTEAALREAKVFEELTSSRETDWTFSAARIYAALGRADKAVPLLEQELRAPLSGRWPLTPALLRLDPLWDKLRGDPRFLQLCAEPATPAPPSALTEAGKLAARAVELYSKSNYTRDDLATAEELTRKATELEPDSAAAWGARAGVHATYLSRNWDVTEKRRLEIQSATARALGLNPDEPEALLARGRLLTVQGPAAWPQAEAALRQAVAVRPTDNRFVRALAIFLGFTGRVEEERVILGEVLQRGSRDPLVHYDLAMSYANYGTKVTSLADVKAAVEHLDAGIAVQPLGSLLLLKAALVAANYGDLTSMRAQLDQLEKLPLAERVEDRAVFIALWGALLERKPERVAAAAALTAKNYFEDTVVPYRPKDWALALAHQIEGKANLARLDWQRAEAVLRQRGRDDPNNQIITADLAITLAWLGRTDEAARELAPIEAAWREELTVQRARRLAFFYGATGEAGKAAPYLQRALNSGTFFMTHTVRLDPWWDKLRGQPEFEALLAESAGPKTAAGRPVDEKSVAVLAFANLSSDKEQEYFSDGISEELLNVLAKVPKLKVAARTSSFSFKGQNVPIPEIGQKLGVAYVVEGSVRKAGNKVRITAQLIKAVDGYHVWSETYDRDLTDIFAVQDEIAKNILGVVKGSLLGEAELPHATTTKIEAYTLFLQAQGALAKRGETNLREAIRLYEAALAIDPNYVPALVGRAKSRALLPNYASLTGSVAREMKADALQAVTRAIELDPQDAAAHAVKGWMAFQMDWRWSDGLAEVLRACELAPNDAWNWNCLGDYHRWVFDLRQALVAKKRAWELDPLSAVSHWDLSVTYLLAGKYDEAYHWAEQGVKLAPHNLDSYVLLILISGRTGRFDLMHQWIMAQRQNVHENEGLLLQTEADAALMEKKPDEARQILARIAPLAKAGNASPAYLGYLLLRLGDADQAAVWLQRGYDERDPALIWNENIDYEVVAANPKTRPILDQPGLKELYELRQRNVRAGLNQL